MPADTADGTAAVAVTVANKPITIARRIDPHAGCQPRGSAARDRRHWEGCGARADSGVLVHSALDLLDLAPDKKGRKDKERMNTRLDHAAAALPTFGACRAPRRRLARAVDPALTFHPRLDTIERGGLR
jgi:hypothetical protein